jgi:hypothetical protein
MPKLEEGESRPKAGKGVAPNWQDAPTKSHAMKHHPSGLRNADRHHGEGQDKSKGK